MHYFVLRLKPRSNLFEYSTLGTVPVSWMECISGNLSDHNGNGNEFKKAMSKITLHASHCLTVTACNCLTTRWNSPMWHFWDGCKEQSMVNFSFFTWTPRMQLHENSPAFDKFAWDRVIQFGRIHIHLLILKKKPLHFLLLLPCGYASVRRGFYSTDMWSMEKTKQKQNKRKEQRAKKYLCTSCCFPSVTHRLPKLNRPLPSSKNPHFQNKARCTTFLVKMSFICMRPGGTRKWPFGV